MRLCRRIPRRGSAPPLAPPPRLRLCLPIWILLATGSWTGACADAANRAVASDASFATADAADAADAAGAGEEDPRLADAADATVALPAVDAALPPSFREVQGCRRAAYVDQTAPDALRRIRFTHGLGAEPERCMRVLAGQTVAFVGDLSVHPIVASEGDADNPIAWHVDGRVTFDWPGVFGYVCGSHPGMRGAILVVSDP